MSVPSPASNKDRILERIRTHPFVTQQELAESLGITRSAVASHVAQLVREHRLLGRAYVLSSREPILVAGGANLDRIAKSLGPVAMGTSNPVTLRESFGGVARNVAENLARMGLPVRLMTVVGDDVSGNTLLQHARDLGMDTGVSLISKGACTGTYTAMLRQDGEMVIAMADMAVMDLLTLDILNDRRNLWASTRMRMVDLNLGKPVLQTLIEDSRQRGATLIVVAVSEPKMDRLPRSLEGVSTLILNVGELSVRVGRRLKHPHAVMEACLDVQAQGAKSVVVTLGSEGIVCSSSAIKPKHLKALRCRIVDVTGAGDAFSAGVVASLANHPDDLIRACRLGQRLAKLTLGCRSSVAPTLTPDLLA